MTHDELVERLARIDNVAAEQKKQACFEYVRDNAKFRIGDLISDSTDTIKIERLAYRGYCGNIEICYFGPLLTKKGQPRKDGECRYIHESRITKYKYGEEIK